MSDPKPHPDPEEADDLYELAEDLDNEPEPPPPAYTPPVESDVQPVIDTAPSPTSTPASESLPEEPAYVSDAVKAERRQQQRIAAAQAEAEKKNYGSKKLYIIIGLLIFLVILIWGMYALGDALFG